MSAVDAVRCRAGFTLVEVLVALVIVSTVSLSLLAAVGASSRAAQRTSERQVAAALADEMLNEASLLTLDEATSLASGGIHVAPPPLDDYRWRLEIDAVDGLPRLTNWSVTVTRASGGASFASAATRLAHVSQELR